MRATRTAGQALLELVGSLTLVSLVLTGAGWILKTEWERGKCAYVVFQGTHDHLVGARRSETDIRIAVSETDDGADGYAECGSAVEHVSLKRLQKMPWAGPL